MFWVELPKEKLGENLRKTSKPRERKIHVNKE